MTLARGWQGGMAFWIGDGCHGVDHRGRFQFGSALAIAAWTSPRDESA